MIFWTKRKSTGQKSFFYLLFFIPWHTPIPPSWWIPSSRRLHFFYWDILRLSLLISFIPLDTFMIIAIRILVKPYFYFLICYIQSGTSINNPRLASTTFSHIFFVLKQSRIHLNNDGFMLTAFSRSCFVLIGTKDYVRQLLHTSPASLGFQG